jgi:hypothetical protein
VDPTLALQLHFDDPAAELASNLCHNLFWRAYLSLLESTSPIPVSVIIGDVDDVAAESIGTHGRTAREATTPPSRGDQSLASC